ncbi:MAG TPA: hypothetical protein VI338_06250 [Nitrososphaera sp.]|nr:hypothetical protein [Nitrososphaera sp.]
MTKCPVHTEFFDDSCDACKQEYLEMKGVGEPAIREDKKYKEFTEERAKKLYEGLMLQYIKNGVTEVDADRKAKAIIRKQCSIRGMPFWPWT